MKRGDLLNHLETLNQYKEDMIHTLQELLKIKSVNAPPKGDMPFGEGIHKALMYVLDKGETLGFKVKNVDNYSGHIEVGEGKEILGILVHLDVVPEGSGWDMDPYGGEIIDGKIYGRGAVDNKGSAAAILYALKALKEANVKFNKRVRLILGTNEESSDWKGIDYYLKKEETPNLGFVPDANFPVIHAEMGILICDLIKKIKATTEEGLTLKSISGGNAPNMVPDSCKAIIMSKNYDNILELAEKFNTGEYKIKTRIRGKSMEVLAEGISAHGAHPEKGQNAISILMKFLGNFKFSNDDINEFIKFYNDKIGMNLHGENIGCSLKDDISGNLIFNVGEIKVDTKTAGLTINIRYPVTLKGEEVYQGLRSETDAYEFGIVKKHEQLPIYLEVDHPLVRTLMEVYQKHTGDEESKPIVIGGGTYARAFDNAVAFGPTFKGQPSVEHQKNEYISIDNLFRATQIYTDAIYELVK